jgi:hypothetical protein
LGTSGSKTLSLSLTNNGAASAAISGISISWVDPGGGQRMQEVQLNGTKITNDDDEDPDSLIPGEIAFFGSISTRSIPSYSTRSLEVEFLLDLEATGYSISVSFGSGCDVDASR